MWDRNYFEFCADFAQNLNVCKKSSDLFRSVVLKVLSSVYSLGGNEGFDDPYWFVICCQPSNANCQQEMLVSICLYHPLVNHITAFYCRSVIIDPFLSRMFNKSICKLLSTALNGNIDMYKWMVFEVKIGTIDNNMAA